MLFLLCLLPVHATQAGGARVLTVQKQKQSGGWLGVSIEDVTSKLQKKRNLKTDEGAYVTDVSEDSPAEEAGIREGDVIVKFENRTIYDADDLLRAVRKTPPKMTVQLEVYRGAEQVKLSAKLGKMPRNLAGTYFFADELFHGLALPRVTSFASRMEIQGMVLGDMTKQLGEFFEVPGRRGVLVYEVEAGSDAETAGFKAGDVIVKVNAYSVRNIDNLREEINDVGESGKVPFDVIRRGKPVTLTMTVETDDELSLRIAPPDGLPEVYIAPKRGNIDHRLDALRDYIRNILRRNIESGIEKVSRKISREVMRGS